MSITFSDFLREIFNPDGAAEQANRVRGLAKLAWQVRRERDQLAKLTPEQLADIGIHPTVAQREAKRDLLDLPKSRADKV